MRVGVDIGGTFTDLVVSVDGQLHVHKLLSTPDDPSRAMLAGLNHIAPTGLTGVVHGTTVATNAILERRGAKVALITTMGYRDVLAIGRQNRPDLYALYPTIPAPLVPREQCYGLTERLDANGNVLTPLDKDHLAQILDALEAQGIEAVAISLLYSYLNPDHELAVRDAILVRGLLDDGQIALSHEILPEFREYERASTVSLEAYVRPVMSRYLSNLEQQLPDGVGLRVMNQTAGGQRKTGCISIGTDGIEWPRCRGDWRTSSSNTGRVSEHHYARYGRNEYRCGAGCGGTDSPPRK